MKKKLVLICMLSYLAAFSITVRHDRTDKEYLNNARHFNQVCKLAKAGDATLIGKQWLITAAHVANSFTGRLSSLRVEFAGKLYAADKIFIHPKWVDMGPHDIALIHLAEPVSGVTPVAVYNKFDEKGRKILLVGHGDTRTGQGSNWVTDFALRAATNKVDETDERTLMMSFTEPPAGTYLEGVSGRGDSGGPAFIQVGNKFYIAGVSSVGEDGKNGPATYGAKDYYTRISKHIGWVNKILATKIVPDIVSPTNNRSDIFKDTIPDTPAGKRMKNYIAAIEKNNEQALIDFINKNFSPKDLESRPAKERRAINTNIPNALRGAKFITAIESRQTFITVKFKGKYSEDIIIGMECEAAAPFWLVDVFRN